MDPSKLLVAGSSDASPSQIALGQRLGRHIIQHSQYNLITGGLAGKAAETHGIDCAVAGAAAEACEAIGADARQRILTMLPAHDSNQLRRCEHGTVKRVRFADTRSRRYAMVLASDAVITIGGGPGTQSILDLAWIAERALIPLPSTGGASADRWQRYGDDLVGRLRITRTEKEILESASAPDDEIVSVCFTVLERNLRPRCFVAMPYAKHPLQQAWSMFRSVLEDRGFNPIRVDKETFVGSVLNAIWSSIRQSDLVIADITGSNPNVFYELGIAHALSKPVIITVYSEDGRVPENVPFDITDHRLVPYESAGDLAGKLDREILAVRSQAASGRRLDTDG